MRVPPHPSDCLPAFARRAPPLAIRPCNHTCPNCLFFALSQPALFTCISLRSCAAHFLYSMPSSSRSVARRAAHAAAVNGGGSGSPNMTARAFLYTTMSTSRRGRKFCQAGRACAATSGAPLAGVSERGGRGSGMAAPFVLLPSPRPGAGTAYVEDHQQAVFALDHHGQVEDDGLVRDAFV